MPTTETPRRFRTMYAVVLEDSFVEDAAALFDDETHAEEHAAKMTGDPDYDGVYHVVTVQLDRNGICEIAATTTPPPPPPPPEATP